MKIFVYDRPRHWVIMWVCALLLLPHAAAQPMMGAARGSADAAAHDTRGAMCRAVIREMHIEIHKHSLRKNGEDDIYETVPAICLAIVQNYTLAATPPPHTTWTLAKRTTRLDDDENPDPSMLQNLMVLKRVCELFTEEFQQELSELMYRAALEPEVSAIEQEFCTSAAVATPPPPPPPPRKRRTATSDAKAKASKQKQKQKKKKDDSEAADTGGMPDMDTLLKKYDTDGSISNMLEMERANPEAMLEADQLAQVQQGAADIRCEVCEAATKVALTRAKKRKLLADEERLSELVGLLCYGSVRVPLPLPWPPALGRLDPDPLLLDAWPLAPCSWTPGPWPLALGRLDV